ncbi:FecR family protein [Runella zeae]|uniref:FecR family protein n=1 Tax=Runella zeae TaxID=94255 RepID=UPI0003F8DDC7|nr:FecR domain-containing protein [Runella zeae]
MQKNLSKEQLFDYFAGKSSLLVKSDVETWLKTPAHAELYYVWLEEWERQHLHWQPDTEHAFNQLQDRMATQEDSATETGQTPSRPLWYRSWWVAAASIVLLLGVSYLFRNVFLYRTYTTEYGNLQNVQLEDGTLVNLNANSTLRVPRFGFGTDTRQVLLEGEAYFSVTHTATHQKFVVKTNRDFSIEVLGTEFAMRERAQGMQVVLDKGKVKVHYGKANQPITMKPGDLVILNNGEQAKLKQTTKPQVYSAWRNHRFVFERTSLREVGYLLKDNYGIEVKINSEALAKRTISGEIEAKNAEDLIEALSEVFDLKIIKNKNSITIVESI